MYAFYEKKGVNLQLLNNVSSAYANLIADKLTSRQMHRGLGFYFFSFFKKRVKIREKRQRYHLCQALIHMSNLLVNFSLLAR